MKEFSSLEQDRFDQFYVQHADYDNEPREHCNIRVTKFDSWCNYAIQAHFVLFSPPRKCIAYQFYF